MKINSRFISIPPYISTHWGNINSLHMQENVLIITLVDGKLVEIPDLEQVTINSIFNFHAGFIEQNSGNDNQSKFLSPLSHTVMNPHALHRIDVPFRLGMGIGSMEDISSALQHNPNLANTPEIPAEILNKIVAITKIVQPEGIALMPKPEPSCNCVHCQIARAMSTEVVEVEQIAVKEEEEVLESDLNFQQWEITQTGDQLYSIVNKLDSRERYSVYLGHPVGCTCGKEGCEHIVAVLKS